MKTSPNGLDLIRNFEGCKLAAYFCSAGYSRCLQADPSRIL